MDRARNLLRLRSALGYSQARLARALRVSQSTVSRWESGELVPGRGHQVALQLLWRNARLERRVRRLEEQIKKLCGHSA